MNATSAQMNKTQLQQNVSLARYTTWGIGGAADYLICPANLAQLQEVFAQWDSTLPVTWLGLGSNVLIRDGGIRGLVVLTRGFLERIELQGDGVIRAESGVTCPKLSKFAAAHQLGGAEFFAGIPGTLGGALAMNAGAFGSSTWDLVEGVEVIGMDGQLRYLDAVEFKVGYRNVCMPDKQWFVSARLRLPAVDSVLSHAKVKKIIATRSDSQPIGQRSCGSVFKNPPGQYAAQLIEQCGLKGFCIGGACVSNKHANFIINKSNATAADIEALIQHIQLHVKKMHGVVLEPEVRILGESCQ